MTWRVRLFALASMSLTLLAFGARPASAQSAIAGVVHDSSGAVLPGVTVEAASPALIEGSRTAVTDGTRRVPHRKSAPRRVHGDVHADRVPHREARGHHLPTSFTATVNADLAVGQLEEAITVTGESPLVDVRELGVAVGDEPRAARHDPDRQGSVRGRSADCRRHHDDA